MARFKVSYIDSEGDLTHVSVEADSREGAMQQAKSEYWDIKDIIQVAPL